MPHASQLRSAAGMSAAPEANELLSDLLSEAAEVSDAAPCIIARNINSLAAKALTPALATWRARGLTPLLLLAERPDAALAPRDVQLRIATPDVATVLREQVLAAGWVWCGGSASRGPEAAGGRLFMSLSPTELRSFAMVFQGLWAASQPFAMSPSAEQDARRRTMTGGRR